jgi:hypothetical protein
VREIRGLSTDTQYKLIERLFLKLQSYYGTRFNNLWHGIPADEVKKSWMEALSGFTSEEVGKALDICLGEKYPPNLPEFVSMCRSRTDARPALANAEAAMPPEKAAAIIAEVNKRMPDKHKPEKHDPKLFAKKLRDRYTSGEKLLPIQISMASEALGEKWAEGKILPREVA